MSNKNKNSIEDRRAWPLLLTAKAVIVNKNEEILILKRSKKEKTHPSAYDLPGGTLEKGESINALLKREIKEETGLDIEGGYLFKVSEYPDRHKKIDDIKGLRFIVRYPGNDYEKIKLNKKEHESFEWLDIEKAIDKFSKKDGFENEKRETILKARDYLEMQKSLDGWKRCLAEFDNYKKIQAESNKSTVKYATENIIMQILPVLDNFSSSIDHVPEDQKDGAWVTGIMYIKKQLEDVLKENGIEEINAKAGDKFDEKLCEAVDQETRDKDQEKGKKKHSNNKISKVILKGYKIGERVIRPAKVIVG